MEHATEHDATARRHVPAGLSGIRQDFAHYCKVHRAHGLGARLLLPFTAPSFLALAVYRFGRWAYAPGRSPPLRAGAKLAYKALFEVSQRLCRTYITVDSEIAGEVWIASHGPVFVTAHIGRGSALGGANTLGQGDPTLGGFPTLGENVTLGPGAFVLGRVRVPDGTVIGPNALVTKGLPASGVYVGVPARRVVGRRGEACHEGEPRQRGE